MQKIKKEKKFLLQKIAPILAKLKVFKEHLNFFAGFASLQATLALFGRANFKLTVTVIHPLCRQKKKV